MKLAVFMTYGMSLTQWKKNGIFDREKLFFQEMSKHLEEVHLFTYGGKEEEVFKSEFDDNVFIHTNDKQLASIWYQFWMVWKYRQFFKKVDIIRTNQMKGALSAVLANVFFNKKLVIRCGFEWLSFAEWENYKWWKRALIYWLERIAYKTAMAIIITSEEGRAYIGSKFPTVINKIRLVPNYVDIDRLSPIANIKQERGVVYIGRLSKEQKNLVNLIRSFEGLNLTLTLVGDGSERKQLEKLARELGVQVNFLGRRSSREITEILGRHRFFILPSFYEGNPKALLEAMSMGKVCIGTQVAGIREIITDGVNGFLSGVSSKDLRNTLIKISKKDEFTLDKISKKARNTIMKDFSLKTVVNKEFGLYEALR